MVKVDIFRDEQQAIVGFKTYGHAEVAPKGADIVCAGISALTQAAVLGLQRHLGRSVTLEVRDGYLAVLLQGGADEKTSAVLETMLIGLQEIAALYRKRVQIREHRG